MMESRETVLVGRIGPIFASNKVIGHGSAEGINAPLDILFNVIEFNMDEAHANGIETGIAQ